MKRVVILTEGGKDKGFGHVTRCLSVYQAFEKVGIIPNFIINGDESISQLFCGEKYRVFDWVNNEEILFDFVNESDIAIVDSYFVDSNFYDKIQKKVKLAVYFDDNNRVDYPEGIVVNGSIYAPELGYSRSAGKEYLLGTRYLPQRREFRNVNKKIIREDVRNIVVTFGGITYADDVYAMIESIKRQSEFKFDVMKPKKGCFSAKEFMKFMENADICISGGGQTLYELSRVGMPTIGISFADNQNNNLEAWSENGFLEYVGSYNCDGIVQNINGAINKLKSRDERMRRSKIGRKYVDGKGSARIVKILLAKLRKK